MILVCFALSICILILIGYIWRSNRTASLLTKEIDHFLLYAKAPGETLEEGCYANLTNMIRRLESQLLHDQKQAALREEELIQFMENMAHQMKTAVSVLQLRLDLAEATASPDHLNPILQSQAGLRRLSSEIDRILTSSQLAAGKIPMKPENCQFPELITQCIHTLSPIAEKKLVTFQTDLPAELSISADAFWLSQAIENLLKNAIEHTASSTCIQVALFEKNQQVHLKITDCGDGIPYEELPQIFIRFHRGNATKAGYGIGLSMAYDIIKAHHGSLTAGNANPNGAWFLIVLPQFFRGKIYDKSTDFSVT